MILAAKENGIRKWAIALTEIYNLPSKERYGSKIQRVIDTSPNYSQHLLQSLVNDGYLVKRKTPGKTYYDFTAKGEEMALAWFNLMQKLPRRTSPTPDSTSSEHF